MTNGTPTLRQTERDLYAAAEELRETDLADVQARIDGFESKVRQLPDDDPIPDEWEREYQQAKQQARELAGTADTYEEYADRWGDGETCVFVLEELNGDAWAATIDAVRAEGQRQGDTIPEGYGRVKALEYGVVEKPDAAPADPGTWPAPIVNELFEALESITAPSGVDMGNDSLASVRARDRVASTPPTPDGGSSPE